MPANPFDPHLCAQRVRRLRVLLEQRFGGAPMLVTDPVNVRYLTGLDSSNAALLVGPGELLLTDARYELAAAATGLPVELARDVVAAGLALVGGSVLLEGHHLTAARWERIRLERPEASLVPDLVSQLRRVKDAAELAAIEAACAASQEALAELLRRPVLGRSELELAQRLEASLGGAAFPCIVAAGPNSAEPHHRPTGRRLERGDLLLIDFGSVRHGYCADLTRTFVVAAEPQPWQLQAHAAVLQAASAAAARARAGVPLADLDAAARSAIAGAGLAQRFNHGLGHGIGLAVHESPLIGPSAAGTLESGMAVTIEPGVYLPQRGGVRIEDTVEVRADGCRSLVTLPRELVTVA